MPLETKFLRLPTPKDSRFDWVRERSKSLGSMFEVLANAVKQDVESVVELLKEARDAKTIFAYKRDRAVITVSREKTNAIGPPETVVFSLSSSVITVERSDGTQFLVSPSLNQEGKCKMTIDGHELELWQVCQKALDALFFGDGTRTSATIEPL
jgi:hypothetical protein